MSALKTKGLERLESKMSGMDEGSIRYRILANAKSFKTSWIELGQGLYSVCKDKMYREWGYMTFDAYTSKEIGIKKQTALKLLNSYYFLEKEEPQVLRQDYSDVEKTATIPSYESVNVLRMAKKKALDEDDYKRLKSAVLVSGKDVSEVKKDLTAIMKQREELDPEEARTKRKAQAVRRLLSTLKAMKRDFEMSKLVSTSILKETSSLIRKIEDEIAKQAEEEG